MRNTLGPSRSLHVMLAAVVPVALAGLLVARLAASPSAVAGEARPRPPAAVVPAPPDFAIENLAVPCWGCPEAEQWPIRFRTDLDRLAPLGNGTANAAVFFKDFARTAGAREAEADAARALRFEHPKAGWVFPYDLPLVQEAEPWCDQATMRYYPDLFPLQGYATRIPDLLFQLTLARTWVARGYDATDPGAAMADFRRAIRLGRLLRQEDVVIINDLVGLACIRLGAQGIYDLAARQGDVRLELLASVVLGEHAPQRLLTAARLTDTEIGNAVAVDAAGAVSLRLADARLDAIVARARSGLDRRFRNEAMLQLNLVRFLAPPAQQERAREVLDELTRSDDPVVAASARFARDTPIPAEQLDWLRHPRKTPTG